MIKQIAICTIILIWSIYLLVITVHLVHKTFTPHHYTYRHFISITCTVFQFTFLSFGFTPFKFSTTSLHHITTLHFTSLHFYMIFATLLLPSLHPVYKCFLLFLKMLDLHRKVPNTSAGSWLQIFIIRRMHCARCVSKATHAPTHTHRIFNTYCSSMATVVTRTRLSVTWHVHCPSLIILNHFPISFLDSVSSADESVANL
jgi:hypothetical protein